MADKRGRNDGIISLPSQGAPLGPAIIERFPEHARLIGFFIAEWSQVEHNLVLIFAICLEAPSPVVRPMLYAIESSGARLEAMIAALKQLFAEDAETRELLVELFDQAKSLLHQRNKFAHSLYGVSATGEMAILGIRKQTASDLPLHDLQDQFNRIRRLSHRSSQMLAVALGRWKDRPPAPEPSEPSEGSAPG